MLEVEASNFFYNKGQETDTFYLELQKIDFNLLFYSIITKK